MKDASRLSRIACGTAGETKLNQTSVRVENEKKTVHHVHVSNLLHDVFANEEREHLSSCNARVSNVPPLEVIVSRLYRSKNVAVVRRSPRLRFSKKNRDRNQFSVQPEGIDGVNQVQEDSLDERISSIS